MASVTLGGKPVNVAGNLPAAGSTAHCAQATLLAECCGAGA